MSKDYYQILNVPRTADAEEIKKSYRKLAHQFHPDKKDGDASKFKEINEAYQVLSDPKKRTNYDNFGYAYNDGGFGAPNQDFNFGNIWDLFGGRRGGHSSSSGAPEDIFDMFSDMFGAGAASQNREEDQSGEDIYLDVNISKKDLGKRKVIEFQAFNGCKECNASGVAPGFKMVNCTVCGGGGHIKHSSQSGFGIFTRISVCHNCKGKGKMPEKECRECSGTGRTKSKRKIEIVIPTDISDRYSIAMPMQGNAGKNNNPPGDLVINLKIK